MSIEIVKREINRFLEDSSPEVLAIRGAWGVGKTFAWNRFIEHAQNEQKIALKKYSYVSLFGINSLDVFKFSIFEQVIETNLIGTKPDLETFKTNANGILSSFGRKYIHLLKGIPFIKNANPALESISFLSLKNVIVCIDDFERKGSDLNVKDVLGLVSVLKEQKACKVVLILNDESFQDIDLEEFKKFREKVIDIEILFDPSPSECVEIALPNDDLVSNKLKEFCATLGINNIRIIKKIERIAHILKDYLSEYEPEITHQALHSLALFSWCFLAEGEHVPDPDWVKKIGYTMFGLSDEEATPQDKLWKSVLEQYGYQTTDEFDLVIALSVETGYVDEAKLQEEANKLNQQIIASKSESSFGDAWRLYHDSFDDNEDEVCQKIYESFKKNYQFISPMNLDGSVRLLRDLGRGKEADELIEFYIEKRKDSPKLFDLDDYAFSGDIKDKKIQEKFKEATETTKQQKSLREVLSNISGKNSWGGDDTEVLFSSTEDDYYNLFKSEKGEHLSRWINTCLKFGRFTNASDRDKKISESATNALIRIAKESRINARRVAKFGIKKEE